MKMYGSDDFHWEKDELYEGTKKTGISVVLHHVGARPFIKSDGRYDFYKIQFSDNLEDLSTDYYNISRAKDNAMKYAMQEKNKTLGRNALYEPVDESSQVGS